jgi:hypothetical protein
LLLGNEGTETDFIASLKGSPGDKGDPGAPGTGGLGDFGTFWDTTNQGDQSIDPSFQPNTAYSMTFNNSDPGNVGVSMTAGSRITFSRPGTYNIAFSAQISRSQGGNANLVSIWLARNGSNVADSAGDLTLVSNGQRDMAAWNYFVEVECDPTCDYYQLRWSSDFEHTGIIYAPPRSSPARPAVPSIILTVNQVQ